MSSFVEFQAILFDKLCLIENRLSNIEAVLGIEDSQEINEENCPEVVVEKEETVSNECLKDELADFHESLADIKSLFSLSDN